MGAIDFLKGIFSADKSPTQGDVLANLREKFPIYNGIDDAALARAAAKKLPEQFGFFSQFDPAAPVPPAQTPRDLRDDNFYKKNPELGTTDALDFIERFKSAQPRFKNIDAKDLAVALEAKFPEHPKVKGLYSRLVGRTTDLPGVAQEAAAAEQAAAPKDELPALSPQRVMANKIFQAGMDSFELGDKQAALDSFNKALKIDPEHPEVRDSMEHLLQLINPAPPATKESQDIYRQGEQLLAGGDMEGAATVWEKALQADPKNHEARVGLKHIRRHQELAAAKKAPIAGPDLAPDTSAWMIPSEGKDGKPGALDGDLQQGAMTYRLLKGAGRMEAPSKEEGLDHVAGQESLRYIQGAPRAAERMLLRGVMGIPSEALGGGMSAEFAKDAVVAGLGEFHGLWSAVTGQPSPMSDELVKAMADRKVSPEIARMAGETVGGIGIFAGAMAALGAEGLAGNVGRLLAGQDPILARYLAPMAAVGVGSGGVSVLHEGARQVVEGKADLARLGKVALSGTAWGAAAGLGLGLPTGILQAAGSAVVGAAAVKAAGGSDHDALVSALVMGGLAAVAAPEISEAQKAGAVDAVRSRLKTAVGQEAAARGLDAAGVRGAQAAAEQAFAGQMELVVKGTDMSVRSIEKMSGRVRDAARNFMDKLAPAPEKAAGGPSPLPPPNSGEAAASASSRFADLLPVPSKEEFFRETPEERAARRKAELDVLKKPEPVAAPAEDPDGTSIEPAHPVKVEVPPEDVLAHAKALHAHALAQWEGKVTPLELFIRANGGLKLDGTERGEFIDVPVRLRGEKPARPGDQDLRKLPSDMEQMAKEQGAMPLDSNIYRALGEIKKRGERPPLHDFVEPARAQLEHEYEVYGPPSAEPAHAGGEAEAMPFEKGPGYSAGAPVFYSQIQKVVQEKVPNSAPVEQVRNILKGGSIKQEELDWSGVDEFLKGKEKVSKAELMEFLRGNEVKVEEVMKGKGEAQKFEDLPRSLGKMVERYGQGDGDIDPVVEEADKLGYEVKLNSDGDIESIFKKGEMGSPTKFHSYQLAGGENYRELLLTTPGKPGGDIPAGYKIINDTRDGTWGHEDKYGNRVSGWKTREAAVKALERMPGVKTFRSHHFEESNILAHVRLNDRTTTDGKKMLFLEEVQSDWHQKGRKEGYEKPAPSQAEVDGAHKEIDGINQELSRVAKALDVARGDYKNELNTEYQDLLEKRDRIRRGIERSGVPEAPFKKSWPEMALKRMLRYAVDNGYDAIGWTTGDQQADRYDLSKQVDAIRYAKRKDGTFDLSVFKGESPVVVRDRQSPADLESIVGKEMARKIVDGVGNKSTSAAGYESVGDLEGLDLKVGGEGMKGFYDQIIPSFLNKYTKKWGGRVGTSMVKVPDIYQTDRPVYEHGLKIETPVHSLDITPSMTESVSQGQPLFEKQPGLFGGAEPARAVAKAKAAPEGQMQLWGGKARPTFALPVTGEQGKALLKTTEGAYQTEIRIPEALKESVVIKDLAEQGFLPVHKMTIKTPEDTAAIFSFMKNGTVETFYLVSKDAQGKILGVEMVSVGILDQTLVHPRDTLKGAMLMGAKIVTAIHNHPGGNPTPSREDMAMTRMLARAADSVGIKLDHHVVINDTKFGLIEQNSSGQWFPRVENRVGPAPEMTGKVPLLKPMRTSASDEVAITEPRLAVEFAKGIQAGKGGVMLIAMSTRNQPNGAWYIGQDYPTVKDLTRDVGRIVMRNNANSVIFVGEKLPQGAYAKAVKDEMQAVWGVSVMDFVAPGRGAAASVDSAVNNGWMMTGESGAFQESGAAREENPGYSAGAAAPAGGAAAGAEEWPEGGFPLPVRIYDENRARVKAGAVKRMAEEVRLAAVDAKTGFFVKNLTPLSHELKTIHPDLKKRMRRLELAVVQSVKKDMAAVMPLIKAVRDKMSPEDRVDFDLARKNSDSPKILGILQRNNLQTEYGAVRAALESIYARAKEVGFDLGHREDYHPRRIKDAKGFMAEVSGSAKWSSILKAIEAKQNELKRPLSLEEQASVANSMLRGYGDQISLSKTGNMKGREIPLIDAKLNRFYYDSDAALISYVEHVNDAIEARRFFGKGPAGSPLSTLTDSIGAYTLGLVAEGKIGPVEEVRLREALQARFSPKEMGPWAQAYRDLSYLETIGSVSSALTQLQDLAFAWYRAGLLGGTASMARAAVGKARMTAEDLGVDSVSQEFRDGREVAGALERVIRLSGLEKLDKLGKNSFVDAAISAYRKEARRGQFSAGNLRRIRAVFGEEGPTQIMEDLASGKVTDDVKLLLFNDLLDLQPVAKSEMPHGYLTGGNLRLMYMLKSFTIKQTHYFLDETFRLMGDPKTRKEGIQNLFRLMALMTIAGVGADALKDLVFRRHTTWHDRIFDNLLKLVGLTKFTIYEARNQGVGSAFMKMILPPAKFLDEFWKDIVGWTPEKGFQGNVWTGKKMELPASIPILGKLYYWWFGRGADKTEKAVHKDLMAPYNQLKAGLDERMKGLRKDPAAARKMPREERLALGKQIGLVSDVEGMKGRLAELKAVKGKTAAQERRRVAAVELLTGKIAARSNELRKWYQR